MKKSILLIVLSILTTANWAHDANYDRVLLHTWKTKDTVVHASFYMTKNGNVYLENEFSKLVVIPFQQ